MKPIYEGWFVQIDITNYCFMNCLYCSRYNRHLRKDQRKHMTVEQICTALDSLKEWPTRIGIIGGEPLLHPDFEQICHEIQKRFPASKMGLWTSGPSQFKKYKPLIDQTFAFLAYNEHNEEQVNVCKHQPITIAIKDVIKDEELRKTLIDDCWVQRTWCATINHFGAYFCECAAAQDVLFNEGANAWPVTPDWWRKEPSQFQDQVGKLCDNCGMCIPMERELIRNKREKVSKTILSWMQTKKLSLIDNEFVELFYDTFTKEEIKQYAKRWTPGNYRGDLVGDETSPEGLGFTKEIK